MQRGGTVASVGGFWSYVHADDDAEEGRIIDLAHRIVAEYELQTGKSIELFLDRDSLLWGEHWRQVADETLAGVAFFIPVMTPRYFQSVECRRELQIFIERATRLGVKELVLPLHYVTYPPLLEDDTEDDLVALLKGLQWESWQDLRVEDPTSSLHRKGVARLAARLVIANAKADEAATATTPEQSEAKLAAVVGSAVLTVTPKASDATLDEQEAGTLDLLASMETVYPEWEATLRQIGADVVLVGEIMERGTADIEKAESHGRGFAGRLAITRRVAGELSNPAERLHSLGRQFVSQMHRVDEGTRVLIKLGAEEMKDDRDARAQGCEFFAALRTLATTTEESLDGVQSMIDGASGLEGLSRDLRPPLKRLVEGLTLTLEAREVTRGWVQLMDECGIDCSDDAAVEPE